MNRERLVGDAVVGGLLGHSDDKKIELSFLRGVRKEVIQTTVLDFWKVDLGLFEFLALGYSSEGQRDGWTFFKEKILEAIPM